MKQGMRRSCLLLTAALAGCSKGDKNQAVPSASVSASAHVAQAAASAVPSIPAAPAPLPRCRAIRVSGEAKIGDTPLASGELLDGEAWVSLGKDASVALKHTATGRELSIAGPALFRACRRGREQVLLARGKVEAGAGMGARPGAEVLIATPLAAIRYGEAELSLVLDDKKLSLTVRAGQVEVEPQPDKPGKPVKSPLHAKDKLTLPLGKPDPNTLMALCKQAAEAAEASARRVGDRNAPEPLGERAQAHVRARKLARSACTVAAAATGLVADPGENAGLWADAVRWEGLWETVPRRAPAERGSGSLAPEK
ncbi:MAG TPA: hypothetical protein VJN18_13400 [Polyangiaceae bacterium]|nr:hypothetical protein [Polyangiaceae bacterium]